MLDYAKFPKQGILCAKVSGLHNKFVNSGHADWGPCSLCLHTLDNAARPLINMTGICFTHVSAKSHF